MYIPTPKPDYKMTTLEILQEAVRRVRARPAWMKIGSNNTWRDKE